MMKRLLIWAVAGVLISGVLPASAATRTVQTTVDKLNVRTGPALTSSVITTLPLGASYPVVQVNGDWVQIRLSATQTGWVAGWLVKEHVSIPTAETPNPPAPSAPAPVQPSPASQAGETVKLGANTFVYYTPDLTQPPIGQLSAGDQIVTQGSSNGWIQIVYDGTPAWIQLGQTPPSNQAPQTGNTGETAPTLGTISVNAPVVNLRSLPTTESELLTTLTKGTTLAVLAAQGDWYQVTTPNGQTGWIAGWLVTKPERTVPQNQMVTVLNPDTNLRSGPGTHFAILGRAQAGDKYPIVAKTGDWYQIRLNDGSTAYIAGWLVQSDDEHDNPVIKGDELVGKVIVLDPGHGGNDNGATGSYYATLEKNINLEVAKLLRNKLEASGATVIMTRNDDRRLTLQERVDIAVNNKADLFVSIHHNTHPNTQTNGTIVFYYNKGNSSKLASLVQKEIVQATQYNNLQARFGDYYVLRENPVVSILAEVGFLTNPDEELKLRSPQQQNLAAEGLYKGIMKYFASIR